MHDRRAARKMDNALFTSGQMPHRKRTKCQSTFLGVFHFDSRRGIGEMIQTVIGINSAMMQMPDKKRKKMDYKKELQVIIDQVESAKNRLAEVTEAMDFDDKEVDSLDEALDALDDAIDIMTDSLEEEE